jgi:hypothetical protein
MPVTDFETTALMSLMNRLAYFLNVLVKEVHMPIHVGKQCNGKNI